jgi:hypothetical protein
MPLITLQAMQPEDVYMVRKPSDYYVFCRALQDATAAAEP